MRQAGSAILGAAVMERSLQLAWLDLQCSCHPSSYTALLTQSVSVSRSGDLGDTRGWEVVLFPDRAGGNWAGRGWVKGPLH